MNIGAERSCCRCSRLYTPKYHEYRCPQCLRLKDKKRRYNFQKNQPFLKKAYTSWRGAKERCNNKNAHNYKYYGGKGVRLCISKKEWIKWYLLEMKEHGYRLRDALNVDRIDSSKNYEFGNIRLVTQKENIRKTIKENPHMITKMRKGSEKYWEAYTAKTTEVRKCLICNKQFSARSWSKKRFCGRKCAAFFAGKLHSDSTPVIYEKCGFCLSGIELTQGEFSKRLRRSKTGNIYCSKRCGALHREKLKNVLQRVTI